jgi:hypothetical protein
MTSRSTDTGRFVPQFFQSYPQIYSNGNELPRKRAKGALWTDSWVDLTRHEYGESLGDANYPHINKTHNLIESDNLIDTATLAPLVQTILIRGGTDEKIYHPGSIEFLHHATNKAPAHNVNYGGKTYWEEGDGTKPEDYVFVFPEGFVLKKNEFRTVAVAVADAVEVLTQDGETDDKPWLFFNNGKHILKEALQGGELYSLHRKTGRDGIGMTCTYLYKGNSPYSHWVCIHNRDDTDDTLYGV